MENFRNDPSNAHRCAETVSGRLAREWIARRMAATELAGDPPIPAVTLNIMVDAFHGGFEAALEEVVKLCEEAGEHDDSAEGYVYSACMTLVETIRAL